MVKASTLPSQDLSELMTCVDKFWISCFNFYQHKVNLWIKFQNMNVSTIREAFYLSSATIFFVTLHPLLITLYKSDSFRFSPEFSAYISNNFELFSDFLNRVKCILSFPNFTNIHQNQLFEQVNKYSSLTFYEANHSFANSCKASSCFLHDFE